VVHLLEHNHNTLQGLYIELEVPNLCKCNQAL
jgi:hypothetical protein